MLGIPQRATQASLRGNGGLASPIVVEISQHVGISYLPEVLLLLS